MSFESFQEFISAKLMQGSEQARKTAPIRSEETKRRLDEWEYQRDLKQRIGKDYWEE